MAYQVNTKDKEMYIVWSRLNQGGITGTNQIKRGDVMNEFWTSILIDSCQFDFLCSGNYSDSYVAWFGWIMLMYVPGIAILLATVIRKINPDT